MRVLISAGEDSGDLYAAAVVQALRVRQPDAEFFGCAGPRMQAAGVRPIIEMRSIAVIGLVEVVRHIPRILAQFRTLVRAIPKEKPEIAILTDAPDFHLRLAKRLRRHGIPVVYLIAPQAWAWRQGRVRDLRANVDRLLCIFPFEREFFESRGVATAYIGHPLARIVRPSLTRAEFCKQFGIPSDARVLALTPGSRHGVVERHLPALLDAVERIRQHHPVTPILALPRGFGAETLSFRERIRAASIQVIEGFTWDVLAQAELALTALGTVTVEAALLGVPMVGFYRVNALSWILGRWLVRTSQFCMPNLLAGQPIVPELIQSDMTPERIAAEALRLLDQPRELSLMRQRLGEVAASLRSDRDPMEIAAEWTEKLWLDVKKVQSETVSSQI